MDPQAALFEMLEAIVENDIETFADRSYDLRQWLKRGGAIPEILKHPGDALVVPRRGVCSLNVGERAVTYKGYTIQRVPGDSPQWKGHNIRGIHKQCDGHIVYLDGQQQGRLGKINPRDGVDTLAQAKLNIDMAERFGKTLLELND